MRINFATTQDPAFWQAFAAYKRSHLAPLKPMRPRSMTDRWRSGRRSDV
jgi:hypothetical protein